MLVNTEIGQIKNIPFSGFTVSSPDPGEHFNGLFSYYEVQINFYMDLLTQP